MQVQELMSQPVITCGPGDTLNRVAQLMWEHDCGAIPVTDEDGKVVGIITDRDVCMAAYTQGLPLQAIRVTTVIAREVFSCHPQDSVDDAERLMADKQIRRVPVLDGADRPVGLLSLNDIARESGSRPFDWVEEEWMAGK
jgi:CBS domain-containing protein